MYPESEKSPPKIERILSELIEPEKQTDFCHRIVWFGREVCTARAPRCDSCPLAALCRHREAEHGKDQD
jgi:endonuclease-3